MDMFLSYVQVLNVYCDEVARGRRPAAAHLEFFVREADGVLGRVEAPLPGHGSLGPLFLAFGLITEDELRRGAGAAELGASRSVWTFFVWNSDAEWSTCVNLS